MKEPTTISLIVTESQLYFISAKANDIDSDDEYYDKDIHNLSSKAKKALVRLKRKRADYFKRQKEVMDEILSLSN